TVNDPIYLLWSFRKLMTTQKPNTPSKFKKMSKDDNITSIVITIIIGQLQIISFIIRVYLAICILDIFGLMPQ
ncbi:hypothetical protein, partial [Cyanothece sp. BG0011]|uniref:hypothetical protein n=1 Tax=Cyanothece sp. BG0011 TaxID=2082950 RepID=UPI001E57C0CC